MEANQDKDAPIMASPAAIGYGPTLAMPTLMGMMPEMPSFTEGDSSHLDASLSSDLMPEPNRVPPSIANIFQNAGAEEGRAGVVPQATGQGQGTKANKTTHTVCSRGSEKGRDTKGVNAP